MITKQMERPVDWNDDGVSRDVALARFARRQRGYLDEASWKPATRRAA